MAHHPVIIGPQKSENVVVYHISLYVLSILGSIEEISDMIRPKHSITGTTEGTVTDIKYLSEVEIQAVLAYHCAR